jgi:hypothetical protein
VRAAVVVSAALLLGACATLESVQGRLAASFTSGTVLGES